MSTPMTAPLGASRDGGDGHDIRAYVAAVRARLDDLSAEEVEELTGGLEADLAEALAGSDDGPRERFGEPATYADELRAAAGLGPRPEGGERGGVEAAIDGFVRRRRAAERLWEAPQFGPVRDLLLAMRPAWWVLRGWIAFQVIGGVLGGVNVLPNGLLGMLLLLALVVGSVHLGRQSPPRNRGRRGLLLAGNVVAVIALLMLLPWVAGATLGGEVSMGEADYATASPPGGLVDVRNIFPYDAQGRPLRDVQLLDQDGNPLVLEEHQRFYSDEQGRSWQLRPASDVYGTTRWNAYPLRRAADPAFDPETGDPMEGPAVPDVHPRPAVPPLLAAPTPSAAPTPTTTPGATATPAPAPTGTPAVTTAPTPTGTGRATAP